MQPTQYASKARLFQRAKVLRSMRDLMGMLCSSVLTAAAAVAAAESIQSEVNIFHWMCTCQILGSACGT